MDKIIDNRKLIAMKLAVIFPPCIADRWINVSGATCVAIYEEISELMTTGGFDSH